MAYSNTSIAFGFSKALLRHRHGAAAAPPFSAVAAAANGLHADMREESGLTGGKAEELAAETIGGGTVEVAYDATKATAEKAKDTVIAEANENVMDTTEYRSIEDMGNYQNVSF